MPAIALKNESNFFSPDIQELIDQTTELLKLDIVQGLAYEQESTLLRTDNNANPSKLGSIVSDRLKSLSKESKFQRPDYSKRLPVNELYTADIRSLAKRHNINLMGGKGVLTQIDHKKKFEFIKADIASKNRIDTIKENLFDIEFDEVAVSRDPSASLRAALPHTNIDPGVARMLADRIRFTPNLANINFDFINNNINDDNEDDIKLNKGLRFRLHRVKCIDETNPEWPGSDEIALGGTAVDDNKVATKINEFRVRNGFDDGESKRYSPPRNLATFSLDNLNYPADFLVVLALAEKDGGGLSNFISKLWEEIKDEVTIIMAAVGAAAGAAAGAAIGGGLGTAIAGPLGTVIGLVAGAILGALIGWLISALKDDIFEPKSAALQLPSANATFAGNSLTSPQFTLNFRDHGGYYRAYYSWEITR